MKSRRSFLAAGVSSTFAIAGCLGFRNEPEFASRFSTTTTEPVFENDQLNRFNRPFHAEVYDSSTAIKDALNWDTIHQSQHDEFRDFDSNNSFVAVFVSTRAVTQSGSGKGWCPQSTAEDDKISFTLAFEQYPEKVNGTKENYVILERWNHNGANFPSSATVTVEFVDRQDTDSRTCSD